MNSHSTSSTHINHRILVIDDNPSIHDDFRKVLAPVDSQLKEELDDDEAAIFGDAAAPGRYLGFEIDSAFQGQEGLEKVRSATLAGKPYAVAFVDVRMPPGWDGIETITHIWKEFPDLQIVICTAYSDYCWDDISRIVGNTDQVLVLKKPFDNIEVMQMAHTLCKKWYLTQIAKRQMEDLNGMVNQRTIELREANVRLVSEVAERAVAQEELRITEERFSKSFHASPVPMAIQRIDGTGFLDANNLFFQLLDAPREAVLTGDRTLWTDTETAGWISAELAASRPVRETAASIRTASGEIRQVLVSAESLLLGSIPYRLLILQDITERARLEEELRQAQKMEAVGRLAAGVAHDFNNILTVIMGNTSMQLRNPRLDEKLSVSLHQVVRAAERATTLTRQLLAYSRKQVILRRPVSLNILVEQTISMLRRLIGEHIAVELQLGSDLLPIFADAGNVDQIIMNLVLNARDAMKDGGKLTISTTFVEIDDTIRALHPGVEARRFICLAAKDTGQGMDTATLARIFEPFYTTKDPGKGTGMGLATVYGILRQHNGWVEVESKPGVGTTFRVFFPLSEEAIPEAVAESPSITVAPSVNGKFTILVVEDEEMLREFVTEALGMLGYQVLSAANGKEAIEIWAGHREEISLLLTDVVMPDSISGLQLAHTFMMERPELKVIFSSGYSSELLGPDFEREKRHGFLSKPYLTEQLAKIVAAQLQAF